MFLFYVVARRSRSKTKMLADTFQLQWYRVLITSRVAISMFHLTYRCRDKIAVMFKMISLYNMVVSLFNLFPLVQLKIGQHWFRLWSSSLTYICVTRHRRVKSITECVYIYIVKTDSGFVSDLRRLNAYRIVDHHTRNNLLNWQRICQWFEAS